MSILDDAIREHLELKRAHGADEGELKRLEDEAFGPPQRPDEVDPFAEAPTEFLLSPGETAADVPQVADEHERSGRRPNLTDLQEAPPAEAPTGEDAAVGARPPADAAPGPSPADPTRMPPPAPSGEAPGDEDALAPPPDAPPPSPTDAAEVPLPPPGGAPAADLAPPPDAASGPGAEEAAAPAEEEHPAGEHEIVGDVGPGTEERQAIADQPTQMFDVQAQMDADTSEAPASGEQASPTDEQLLDAAQEQPQAAPPAPEAPAPAEPHQQPPLESRGPDAEVAGRPPDEAAPEEESAEFDFFNEQRLSDELDQALEAPLPPTDEHIAMPRSEDTSAQGAIFDFESTQETYEDDPSQEVLRRAEAAEAAEEPAPEAAPPDRTEEAPRPAPEPPSEEAPRDHAPEPPAGGTPRDHTPEPPSEKTQRAAPDPPSKETPSGSAEPGSEEAEYDFDPETGHEDVLEDTPRFLEDAPEDDDLWFEQKPPKDFDLD